MRTPRPGLAVCAAGGVMVVYLAGAVPGGSARAEAQGVAEEDGALVPPAPAAPPPHALAGEPPRRVPTDTTGAASATTSTAPATSPAPATTSIAVLAGRVLHKGTRDPLRDVRVSVTADGAQQDVRTDDSGRFALAPLPIAAGGTLPVQVLVSGSGLYPFSSTEVLKAGTRTQVTYYAARREGASSFSAVVRGSGARREVAEQVLNSEEVKKIAGNTNDTIKAVQNLPGVARPAFIGGTLAVWGASPNDTLVYADGVPIPLIYHFGGLRSTVNSEFVSDVIFRPGAYGADYGGGLGGVVDVTTRYPRADRIHGSVTLDLIDGSVTVEGPITSKLHFAAGTRLSWISAFLPLFSLGGNQISPFYWDYQLALRYQASSRDDLDLFIFGSTDDVNLSAPSTDPTNALALGSHSYFSRARLRYTHRYSKDAVVTVMPSFGADTFNINAGLSGAGGQPLQLFVKQVGYNLRAEQRNTWHPLLETALGVDLSGTYTWADSLLPQTPPGGIAEAEGMPAGATDIVRDARGPLGDFLGDSIFVFGNPPIVKKSATVSQIQGAPYLIARLTLFSGRLLISPQLRVTFDNLPSAGASSALALNVGQPGTRTLWAPEPRLLVRGEVVAGRLWLDLGLGISHEMPEAAWLAPGYGNPGLTLQFGATYVVGIEARLTPALTVEAQAFYKDLRSLVVTSATLIYDNSGIGRTYGGELLIRQRMAHHLFGWLAYTLSRSDRKDGPELPWHLYRYDQTHILTVLASYTLPLGFSVGARFRYVTGDPITPTVGAVRDVGDQIYANIFGVPYSQRLPAFQQLDLRIDKSFTFNRWKLGIFLDVQNVYNYHNAEGLNYGGRQLYQSSPFAGLPFFPDLGVRGDY